MGAYPKWYWECRSAATCAGASCSLVRSAPTLISLARVWKKASPRCAMVRVDSAESDFDGIDVVRVVGPQPVKPICCGSDVLRHLAGSRKRLQSLFRALSLNDLPFDPVESYGVPGNQQSIVFPLPLRRKERSAFALRTESVADVQAQLAPKGLDHIQVGDVGIAAVGMVLIGIVNRPIEILRNSSATR